MNSALAQSIADLSSRWHNRFSHWRKSSKSGHLRRGVLGEKLACRYLKRNGYKILFCNFRGRSGGEIDVVCRDNDTLVFVEVKTRVLDGDLFMRSALDNRAVVSKILLSNHVRSHPRCRIEGTNLFAPQNGEPPRIDRRRHRHGENGHTADTR